MNDYRSDWIKSMHTAVGASAENIERWNRGYEFHQTHWPVGGPCTPVREAMQFADYTIIDMSEEAEYYWAGYEASLKDKYKSGQMDEDPATPDDLKYATEEIMRFLRGDDK